MAMTRAARSHGLSRRQFVAGAGAAGLGLLAGCGRLPWQDRPPTKAARVGVLLTGSPDGGPMSSGFRQGLVDLGYIEGQNISIEYRWAEGQPDRLPALAVELVQAPVDVIVTIDGTPPTLAAKAATATIPIVFAAAGDPVRQGLVSSLARPGGNVTGVSIFSPELSTKRLELLKQTAPDATRLAVMANPDNPAVASTLRDMAAAAQLLGVELVNLPVRQSAQVDGAFEDATREGVGALVVGDDALLRLNRAEIVDLAARHRLPTIYPFPPYVEVGGLMSYGVSVASNGRRAAYYVDRILKGAKPADLPFEQPMTFDFVVNMKTARELGLTFPDEIMLQVTEVIDQ
jgi:putative ABC transport system substrate-binding protein